MKVLLIDDEALALELMERMLTKIDGIQIMGKYVDPREALKKLSTEDMDAIFLDMEMGGIHGLKFMEELYSRNISVEVVFVTAYSQFAVDAFGLDAADYLLKPVSADRLNKTIQKLLERIELKKIKELHAQEKVENLYIRTLGTFNIFSGEGQSELPIRWRTKKVKELFCFLWQNNDRPLNKFRIMEELWPEIPEDKGAALLHTTVYQLRKVIKELGYENGIQFLNDQYKLAVPIRSDLEEVKSLLEETELTSKQMKKLLSLYEGDYLEQEEYPWCIYEQHNLKITFLQCLKKFIDINLHQKSQRAMVESCLLKMIQLDIYNEQYSYLLMSHYANAGNTKGLIKVYEEYCRLMKEELGLYPTRRIVELYGNYIKNQMK